MSDPCRVWQRSKNSHGYGKMSAEGKRHEGVHRVAYELWVGPIPAGLQIDHLCRNRACINPLHLEVVTIRENVLRGDGTSARNARKTHCLHGHPLSGDNLYVYSNGSRSCRVCMARRDRERRGKR